MALAQCCVFDKQLDGPICCDSEPLRGRTPSQPRAPLIPKLRGHFAEFLSEGSLERLRILSSPTCVGFSTDSLDVKHLEDFLEGPSNHFGTQWPRHHPWDSGHGFSYDPPSGLTPHFQQWVDLQNPVPPSLNLDWQRNINRLSIDYAFRPRLRSRLTLGGIACPRKP